MACHSHTHTATIKQTQTQTRDQTAFVVVVVFGLWLFVCFIARRLAQKNKLRAPLPTICD